MDKLQGGDWNSFFHKFEAVASQSTASVSRPSIVDDNVPLPIIRGHHFDIAYQETMDEHVKCQVCGMLLRRTMFAAHIRQRHAELCPPSMSTDDDSGRHSGLESPDISRNPNFPFSPKLMSPPIDKDTAKETFNQKGQRKHRRRKARRDRHSDDTLSSPKDNEMHSSPRIDPECDDRFFWGFDNRPGPSTRCGTPNLLEGTISTSRYSKVTEGCESGDNMILRMSPIVVNVEVSHADCDGTSKKRRKKKVWRKTKRREHDRNRSSPLLRPRVLPVEPLNLELMSDRSSFIEPVESHSSPRDSSRISNEIVNRGKIGPRTRSYIDAHEDPTRNAFTVAPLPLSAESLNQFTTRQSVAMVSPDIANRTSFTVGQPAQRAEAESNRLFLHVPDVTTVFSPPELIYSQSQISMERAMKPNYNIRCIQQVTAKAASFHSDTVPSDPVTKLFPALEVGPTKAITSKGVSEVNEFLGAAEDQAVLSQCNPKQGSTSEETWRPFEIKSPAYGIILPVSSRQDNDADDATVAFLTSSPEQLSEDDSCEVKKEIEEPQDSVALDEVSYWRTSRQRIRQTQLITSESSDTDQMTIVAADEDHLDHKSSDFDGDVQNLSLKLADLSHLSGQQRNFNVDRGFRLSRKPSSEFIDSDGPEWFNDSQIDTRLTHEVQQLGLECSNGESVIHQSSTHISVLDEAFDSMIARKRISQPNHFGRMRMVLHPSLENHSLQQDLESPILVSKPITTQRLESRVEALSIENDDEISLRDTISPFVQEVEEDNGNLIKIDDSNRQCDSDLAGISTQMLQHGSEEGGSLYDEDYSAEDEELISLHESSTSDYPRFQQQPEYKQVPEEPPFSASHEANSQRSFGAAQLVLPSESVHRGYCKHQEVSQKCMKFLSDVRTSELSVQTVFEDNHPLPVLHSAPNFQRTITDRQNRPGSSESLRATENLEKHKERTPHSFPLHKIHSAHEPYNVSQHQNSQKQCRSESANYWSSSFVSYPNEATCSMECEKQPRCTPRNILQPQIYDERHRSQELPIHLQRHLGDQYNLQAGTNPAKDRGHVQLQPNLQGITDIPWKHALMSQSICQGAPLMSSYNQQQALKAREQQHQEVPCRELEMADKERDEITQREQPIELMEDEMRAMRYIYLMNEQRNAKKSLTELDRKTGKATTTPTNLMCLFELPPIQVEPTAIPEGVSRRRMQEQILPPYYHAQFAVRSGQCVSPCNSETAEEICNEMLILREVMDLELFEPPTTLPVLPKVPTYVESAPGERIASHITGLGSSLRGHHMGDPELAIEHFRRQNHPSISCSSTYLLPSDTQCLTVPQNHSAVQFKDSHHAAFPRSRCSFDHSKALEIKIPNQDIQMSGESVLESEHESDMSIDEAISGNNESDSFDDSTDSETIRRRWDLSPSVSPLTLEALTSSLSSPEGSDSSDDQIDVPVWSKMSRKHAKIAIAVCRNMPKRLQPLCRRFAWQQGITYLLENFCLQKWEIREEHDTESVWFFDNDVRRFKPFHIVPRNICGVDGSSTTSDAAVFYGFNICADIPIKRCRKTIRIEDQATVSLNCKEALDVERTYPESECSDESVDSSERYSGCSDDSFDSTDSAISKTSRVVAPVCHSCYSPQRLSYEKQEFIAMSCCKQFLQQMVARKKGDLFMSTGRSAVHVTSILAQLFHEHRAAYELMIADIIPIPTPDQREIPFSDDAEWVAARILAINRAQNRLFVPSFPPWAAMHRMWKVHGHLQQLASVIGGDYEEFVNECVSVAYNHYYRLKNGIKVADKIPGDLLDLCFAITSERMREHTESVEAEKSKAARKEKASRKRVPLKQRQGLSSFTSQRAANHELMLRCRRVYDEKRQTKRRRWNTMRYLHNALPGAVIEGIDVFDMAQRTNLSVAGIFGPEHKLGLNDLPFASELDNRPAYLDMEELLNLMNHTLAIQSGTTVDHEGNFQPSIDFLTVRGLHFKAVVGSGRCHLMVSPASIPLPPVTVDRYGNMTSIQRAVVPNTLYPELISRRMHGNNQEQFLRSLESPPVCDTDNEISCESQCPSCLRRTDDSVDMDFARTCLRGLPEELLQQLTVAEINTVNTTYGPCKVPEVMTNEDLVNLLVT